MPYNLEVKMDMPLLILTKYPNYIMYLAIKRGMTLLILVRYPNYVL
jgi:hypothetical protein